MRFLVFTFFIFLSFSAFANCDAPVELWLSVDDTQPGKVVLEYEYDVIGDINKPSGLIYRARRLNDEWIDIHSFEITNAGLPYNEFIASEECVPPGEWTYIIPFHCYYLSCYCLNYNTIVVDEYTSDRTNISDVSNITSDEFEEKKMEKEYVDPEEDQYGNDDSEFSDEEEHEDEVFDKTETTDREEVADEFQDEIIIDSTYETHDENVMDEGDITNDESQNEDKTDNETSTGNDLDDEVQDSGNIDKSDGCSLTFI